MNTNFTVGDTVRLKSGGAIMCVRNFRGEHKDFVECIWHEGTKPHREIYPLTALVQVQQ